ncbi:MAG: DUF362 domain-containing protein [Lachnospiraceae bacterium]|nr:DUF362 domain-containing protein [Lachnospiraceae bacterium]
MSKIVIHYSKEMLKGTKEILAAAKLETLVKTGMKVSIKPNLVLASPAANGATTHPEIVAGILSYLRDFGMQDIEIIESSWVGDNTKRAYRVCGYEEIAKKYNVPLIDLKKDEMYSRKGMEVCRRAVETDFLINVPVLKAHCQTRLTCCLKNLKGCISDREKRRFHTIGLHRPIAELNTVIRSDFNVIDGICGDLNFEEGGTPVERNMILAGTDALQLDSYCAELIGYRVEEIAYLGYAKAFGVGELYDENTEVIELNTKNKPQIDKADKRIVGNLARQIEEGQACSACYSALVYALFKSKKKLSEKISVGQGFIGKDGILGCGDCTAGFKRYIRGCPPKAVDIAAFLE